MTGQAALFRAAAPDTLVPVDLPPFTTVYHRASGITHLLIEPAPEILAALADAPLTVTALQGSLRATFDLDDEGALAERLDELVAAGLVERA